MVLKKDFPFFAAHPHLVYLDSAATSQKPKIVLEALETFYTTYNANMHRSIYHLAEEATARYEAARATVARFLHARSPEEIIFTSGATESSNFVVYGVGQTLINEGDEVVISMLEHHAQFVPWQQLCLRKKANCMVIPVTDKGTLDCSDLDTFITHRTKVVAIVHVSNALGTHVALEPIIKRAREVGACVVIDGSQAAPYQPVDVQKLDCDFYFFSGHKALGPMGIGVLYARAEWHQKFYPVMLGGGMIHSVSVKETTFAKPPYCYEGGTPPAAEAIALAVALEYLQKIGLEKIQKHVADLTRQAIEGLEQIEEVRLLGPVDQLKAMGHLVSFEVKGMHAHDVAALLDQYGVCVRAGHHCAQPLAIALGYVASVRASFYLYSTSDDSERFLQALRLVISNRA